MTRKLSVLALVLFLSVLFTACSASPTPDITYDPGALRFSGERSFALEEEFVTSFTNRHSGTEQSRKATEWVYAKFTDIGWSCSFDEWEIINYSQSVALRNVVCRLPGKSAEEILVAAHHDIAPMTIQGADNDGAGISILLHLAEIFAAEGPPEYTLVFVATDAEEYGMIGSRRYIQTHPNSENIIAGISLDNVGREYYDGMNMELIGQFRRYGPIWLALTAREAARVSGSAWDVNLRAPFDQIIDQAAPISFMDQGPMVAAGVPALGFAAAVPAEYSDEHYRLWHDLDDTLARQSPHALEQTGIITEALIRQLSSMDTFPEETGPYLYLDGSRQVVRGLPLYLLFVGFVGLFFVGSYFSGEGSIAEKVRHWRAVLPHYLALWLPLVASVLSLYFFVAVGIMEKFHLYPATTKDPYLLNTCWPAVILFLVGLVVFLILGRKIARRFMDDSKVLTAGDFKSFALFVIGLGGVYVLTQNPFSLLWFVPLLFWFLIRDRQGLGKILDLIFFLLGGLVLYALIYLFGFLTLRYDFAFLWMFMNMFSIRMLSFATALTGTAVIAAGLSMIVNPPHSEVK